jgi:WD40 repeat protein
MSGATLGQMRHAGASSLVISSNQERVLTWDAHGLAFTWDAGSGKEMSRYHQPGLTKAVLSRDGRRAFSFSWDNEGFGLVWDTNSGSKLSQIKGRWEDAMFSPDGSRILTYGREGTARVWDALSGAEISRQVHGNYAGALWFADGRRVLSWGGDDVRVWDAESGTEIVRQTHKYIVGAEFSPAGDEIVSWGDDGTARLWDVSWSTPRRSNQSLINEVCDRVLRGPDVAAVWGSPYNSTATGRSVRRISALDAVAVPLLRDRVGEDVCTSRMLLSVP